MPTRTPTSTILSLTASRPTGAFDDQGHYRPSGAPGSARSGSRLCHHDRRDLRCASRRSCFCLCTGFSGLCDAANSSDIVAQMMAESEKAALAAIESFDAAARRSLISAEHRLLKPVGASAPAVLSTLARRFDLGAFMQSEPNGVDNDDMIEASLFESGRPLIVVPYIQKDGLKLDHVVCCWDGSRGATRAVDDGLPLLVNATTVDLLIVL